jgi:hypothetical protein
MRLLQTMIVNSGARGQAMAVIMTAVLALVGVEAFAANDQGLTELHRAVDAACDCAEGQRTGMAAALACSRGPREFGRLKVKHRDGWDDAARSRAADLEKVIESCLSNALSARTARDRLGLPPIRADGTRPAVYWQPIEVRALRADSLKLVRIRHGTGNAARDTTSTGMVTALGAQRLELRRARSDGGGSETIALRDIERAWVMVINN